MKQSSLDEQEQLGLELESQQQENDDEISDEYRTPEASGSTQDDPSKNLTEVPIEPANDSPNESLQQKSGISDIIIENSCQFYAHITMHSNIIIGTAIRLPWAPKVRQKDIDQFLYDSRHKFIGYSFVGDHKSLAGLPQPIHEGFHILNRVFIINIIYYYIYSYI